MTNSRGIAVDLARQEGAAPLLNRDASWRQGTRLSAKQVALGLRFGLLHPSERVPGAEDVFMRDGRPITRGALSDQIDELFAAWQYQKIAKRMRWAA